MNKSEDKALQIQVRVVRFPGSDKERVDLVAAVRRNCACLPENETVFPDPCPAHDLLGLDATLKHLVFYRRWHRAQQRSI